MNSMEGSYSRFILNIYSIAFFIKPTSKRILVAEAAHKMKNHKDYKNMKRTKKQQVTDNQWRWEFKLIQHKKI